MKTILLSLVFYLSGKLAFCQATYCGSEFSCLNQKSFYKKYTKCKLTSDSRNEADYKCTSTDGKDSFEYTFFKKAGIVFCQDMTIKSNVKYFGEIFRVGATKAQIAKKIWGKSAKKHKIGEVLSVEVCSNHYIWFYFNGEKCYKMSLSNITF